MQYRRAIFFFVALIVVFLRFDVVYATPAWDITGTTYDSKQKTGVGASWGIFMKSDGTRLYVVGGSDPSTVVQYDMSSAWDVSTAGSSAGSKVVSTAGGVYWANGMFISSDGARMYVSSDYTDKVHQYALSTPWDVTSATHVASSSVLTQTSWISGVHFKSDGTKMYISEIGTERVYQYTLSVAWDIESATYDSVFLPRLNSNFNDVQDVFLSSDGFYVYTVDSQADVVGQHRLTTAWDLSSTIISTTTIAVNSQTGDPGGLFIGDTGRKMYVSRSLSTYVVYQYSIVDTTAPTVSTLSPTDNATRIGTNDTLRITFNENISTSTGNVYIRKSSDDSLVETIDVTSNKVTRFSATAFTIDPATTLDRDTSYYVTVDGTAFIDGGSNAYAGISSATTWNFTTVTDSAPSVAATSASMGGISARSATISWTGGNGDGRIVFVKAGVTTGESAPVSDTTYTANSAFGSGTQIGSTGWYAVYKGTGTSVSVSNLEYGQNYRVHVVEFNNNSSLGYERYLTTAGSGNPSTKTAYGGATVYANYSTGNDTTGAGTSGNPYKTFHKAYTMVLDGDTINLTGTFSWSNADETGDSNVGAGGYTIGKSLTILGQKAGDTIIQASSTDNTADRRVFTLSTAVTVTLQNITVRYGKATFGGCIYLTSSPVLTMRNADLTSCRATTSDGGGMYVISATSTIENSSVRGNFATAGNGGGIYVTGASGAVSLTNSTVTGNTSRSDNSSYYGSAVGVTTSAKLSLTNTTVTGNTGYQGAIGSSAGNIYMSNTIIAGNAATHATQVDFYRASGTFLSGGHNIFGEYSTTGIATTTTDWSDSNGDGTYIYGNSASTSALFLNATAAADDTYGTYTHALQDGSIGINQGTTTAHTAGGLTFSIPSTDQRGLGRMGLTDIGSYEYGAVNDSTPPSVSLVLPNQGATILGNAIGMTADATDDTAVAGVRFFVDNVAIGSEDTSAPYSIVWNSLAATTSGVKSVFAVARDTSNNYATSSVRTVTLANQPSPSSINVVTATTTAAVTWTTPVEGSSRMFFGLTNALASSTAEQNTASRVTSHSLDISGLPRCTVFKYQTVSKNEIDEVATSSQSTFTTAGCSGGATVLANNEGDVTVASGGTLTQGVLSLSVPAAFTGTTSTATFQAKKLDGTTFFSSINNPAGKTRATTTVYNLSAYVDAETTLSSFTAPLTVSFSYSDSDVEGLDEASLKIYRYDGSDWSALSNCSVDAALNTISCTTTQFSDFSLFGDAASSSASNTTSASASGGGVIVGLLGTVGYYEANPSRSVAPSAVATSTSAVPRQTVRFTRNLQTGMSGEDVRTLQRFLNEKGFSVSIIGAGSPGNETTYFGSATKRALIRFQEANAAHILTPLKLKKGTGMLGSSTIRFISSTTN